MPVQVMEAAGAEQDDQSSGVPRRERDASVRDRWVLVAMVLSLGMLTIDVTVVRVALPAIQRELGTSDVVQAWVVNAYLLALGVLVVAGGRAGDLFGRRRVFLVGLGLFTGCSVLAGLAPSGGALVAARAGQGAGAAIMTPGTFSTITDTFAGPKLGRAMGVLTGTAAVGLSLGPLLGGALIQIAGWRWIFFINVPIGALAAAAVLATVPERRDRGAPTIDVRGLVVLAAALVALNVGVMQAESWGWSAPQTLALIAAGAGGLAVFVSLERRVAAPLIDPAMLRRRTTAAANGVGFCAQFASTALTVLVAIHLQDALDASALAAGLLLLPLTVPVIAGAALGGRLVAIVGVRRLVGCGMLAMGAGTAIIGAGALSARYLPMAPGLVLFGVGFAVLLTAMTTAVMAGAAPDERGMVSGIYNTARNIGASLGVAIASSLLATLERGHSADVAFALTMLAIAVVSVGGAGLSRCLDAPTQPTGPAPR
jgi:EmrB/QacA subfamily drug resistance transporter